jgi:hypothetical protein
MQVKLICVEYTKEETVLLTLNKVINQNRDDWIEDYYLQGAAYATAHDCIYGTNIEQTVILICTPDNFFQRFIVNGDRFRHYKSEWLKRVDRYYTGKKVPIL